MLLVSFNGRWTPGDENVTPPVDEIRRTLLALAARPRAGRVDRRADRARGARAAVLLSVFAIVPLAALLSHATESVAEKTGTPRAGCSTRHWIYAVFAMTLYILPPKVP
jgi:hypothetical protein